MPTVNEIALVLILAWFLAMLGFILIYLVKDFLVKLSNREFLIKRKINGFKLQFNYFRGKSKR